MKKLLLPALAAVAFVLAPADKAAAQMVVNDPIHMGVHISQFAKQLKEWSETVQNYQVVTDARDIAGVTKQITGEVRDMTAQGLALQQQVQADLRKVQTIQDLYISNPQELFVRALAQAGRTQNNNYMPVYHKAERLRQALQLTNPQQDLNTIFDVFSRFGAGTSVGSDRISSADYQAKKDEAVVSTFAYESMQRKRKIDTAMSYYKIADEMTKQSVELNATLKNPGRYSMTEGERMAALNTSNDNMVKAMQLRLEADRLIGETSQPSPMQGAAENAYTDVILQQELIKMDVYRNHN